MEQSKSELEKKCAWKFLMPNREKCRICPEYKETCPNHTPIWYRTASHREIVTDIYKRIRENIPE